MSFTIYDLATGCIEKTVQVPPLEGALLMQYDPETQGAIDGEFSADAFYVADGTPIAIPPPPAPGHRFNCATKSWEDPRSLEGVRQQKRVAIEVERRRRTNAPIAYGGATLDADKTAQENIANKLLEIGQRVALSQPMPAELLIWRDHDNIDHTFETMDAYGAWLGGLAVAITERGTQAYAWAWQTKATLAAADSIQAVDAITW